MVLVWKFDGWCVGGWLEGGEVASCIGMTSSSTFQMP